MSEMIERAAKAAAREWAKKTGVPDVNTYVLQYWKHHVEETRAVIKTMREPTEAEQDAALERMGPDYATGPWGSGPDYEGYWEAMIAETLEEDEDE